MDTREPIRVLLDEVERLRREVDALRASPGFGSRIWRVTDEGRRVLAETSEES